ncbi:ankyrin repeat domain-containing protein 65-like, partial [Sitodiplosis mosellana]|uniref:ankyrin repeat domain-containing protein 65-like n=1 Tax=Sitodiplosis mosellana TaxID=263140 RepID=UPI002443F18D
MKGLKDVAEKIITKGANLDLGDCHFRTPLHHAAMNDHMEVVELLITKKAKVDPIDDLGRTPLHYAAKNGNLQIAQLLVNDGASVTVKDFSNQTPYQIAATRISRNENYKKVADYLEGIEEKRHNGH